MRSLHPLPVVIAAACAPALLLAASCVFTLPDVVMPAPDGGTGGDATSGASTGMLSDGQGGADGASTTATTTASTSATTSTGGTDSNCPLGWSWSCGNNGINGDPTHLYYCPKGSDATTMAKNLGKCGTGVCVRQDAGVADYCEGGFSFTKPTTNLPDPGNGGWCGGPGTPYGHGLDEHLYYFWDGYVTDLGKCANGCTINSSADDYCN